MQNALANHGTVEHQYQQLGKCALIFWLLKRQLLKWIKALLTCPVRTGAGRDLTAAVNQKMTAEVNSDGTGKASYTLNLGIVEWREIQHWFRYVD
jgi:hypothetical protein